MYIYIIYEIKLYTKDIYIYLGAIGVSDFREYDKNIKYQMEHVLMIPHPACFTAQVRFIGF